MSLETIYQNVIDGETESVEAGIKAELAKGTNAETILTEGLIRAMGTVGERYEMGDLFVPEMVMAAESMQSGMALLKPYLAESGVKAAGTVVIGAVEGDLHDIGKNLVAVMLEGAGLEVFDLGTDVKVQKFVEAAKQHNANVIGLSALLTTTMEKMKATIEAFKAAGMRDGVKVIVGGAPVTEQYAHEIGADGYAPDAVGAVKLVRTLLN
jgi:5-methyltetrahydrofolate--homocysteine methyltransferase